MAISLAVVSTAFFTSTRLGSQTVSKDGMDFHIQVRECDNSPMNVTQNVALQSYNSFGIVAKAYSLVPWSRFSRVSTLSLSRDLRAHVLLHELFRPTIDERLIARDTSLPLHLGQKVLRLNGCLGDRMTCRF